MILLCTLRVLALIDKFKSNFSLFKVMFLPFGIITKNTLKNIIQPKITPTDKNANLDPKIFVKPNEITVPIMFDLFYQEKITLQRIFEVLVKNPVERFKLKNIGQIKSIDKAYSMVDTEYIFHCEDDWEFYDSCEYCRRECVLG